MPAPDNGDHRSGELSVMSPELPLGGLFITFQDCSDELEAEDAPEEGEK
jgi:hypothetical protein